MPLFQLGNFALASGLHSRFKIECDFLTPDDWAALAEMAVELLPPFGRVVGVPRGGIPFANALQLYANRLCGTLLIAEDVVTTGASMERFLRKTEVGSYTQVRGVCAFARGSVPDWVVPVFTLGKKK